MSGKFGTTLRVLKLKVTPREKREIPRGYTFSKRLTSGSTAQSTTVEETTTETVETSHEASQEEEESEEVEEVEDSDEELEDDDEVEEVEVAE